MAKEKTITKEQAADWHAFARVAAPHLTLIQKADIVRAMGEDHTPKKPSGPVYDPKKLYHFDLTWTTHNLKITAPNDLEARALFNDTIKKYPPPKSVKVVLLGEAGDGESVSGTERQTPDAPQEGGVEKFPPNKQVEPGLQAVGKSEPELAAATK